jgi:hypothetical protein
MIGMKSPPDTGFAVSNDVEINQQPHCQSRGEDGECEQYGTARKESKHAEYLIVRRNNIACMAVKPHVGCGLKIIV